MIKFLHIIQEEHKEFIDNHPRFLFHATPAKNVSAILRLGLVPKQIKEKFNNKDSAIYFTQNIEDAKWMAVMLTRYHLENTRQEKEILIAKRLSKNEEYVKASPAKQLKMLNSAYRKIKILNMKYVILQIDTDGLSNKFFIDFGTGNKIFKQNGICTTEPIPPTKIKKMNISMKL